MNILKLGLGLKTFATHLPSTFKGGGTRNRIKGLARDAFTPAFTKPVNPENVERQGKKLAETILAAIREALPGKAVPIK